MEGRADMETKKSEPQISPSPWHIGHEGYSANIIFDANGETVCMVCGIWDNAMVEEAKGCEGMPNAHVLVAAPSMLKALKDTLDDLYHAEGDVVESMRARLRTEIARAEGRA